MNNDSSLVQHTGNNAGNSSFWLMIGTLYFNSYFFKKGIILISPDLPNEDLCPADNSFTINARRFSLYDPQQQTNAKKPDTRSLKSTRELLSSLTNYHSSETPGIGHDNQQSILFNEARREEMFFPIQLENTAMYLYPWTAKPLKNFEFKGFKNFVTAGCMFGASLQGLTTEGNLVEIINHSLSLTSPEQIIAIEYNPNDKNPYEDMLFNEFEKNCSLVSTWTAPGEVPQMTYHLPAEDYILFGIKLALQNQMSHAALEQFIQQVITHHTVYKEKLRHIAERYGVSLTFNSPFSNLFAKENNQYTVHSVLSSVDYTQYASEKDFLKLCIEKLLSQTNELGCSTVWQDFLAAESKPPETIEDLFKIANAVLAASVSQGGQDYEVCSLLPLSEKQIQVQYDQCRKKANLLHSNSPNCYPAQFNLTTFDPVVTYSPTTKGLLFYFAHSLALLSELIAERDLVKKASSQLKFFKPAPEVEDDLASLQQKYSKK